MFFRFPARQPIAFSLGILLWLAAATCVPDIARAQSGAGRTSVPAALVIPPVFTSTSDPDVQVRELTDYVAANHLPNRVVQVDLGQYPKISQYDDIDSSAQGFGSNACGLVAAAAAMGRSDWVALVSEIAQAAGQDYGPSRGIQPSHYVAVLRQVFGNDNVASIDASSLGALFLELQAGKIMIVDVQVNAIRLFPSAEHPSYAHFARVVGMDVARREIYMQNTIRGDAYWTVPLVDFVRAWEEPEIRASLIPDPEHAEDVTRWMVSLTPKTHPAARAPGRE